MANASDRLTTASYWDSIPYTAYSERLSRFAPLSFFDAQLVDIFRQHLRRRSSLLELGIAPGLHSLRLAREADLKLCGIDFSEKGVEQTRRNFAMSGHDPTDVHLADFMSNEVPHALAGQFDAVFSSGLIEHFSNPSDVIARHAHFARPGGLVVITVPNLVHVRAFVPADIRAIHNFAIMSPRAIEEALPPELKVIGSGYFGGVIDLGLFVARHPLVNAMRILGYGLQRITLDPLQRALLRFGINLNNRRFSPGIYVVAKRVAASD